LITLQCKLEFQSPEDKRKVLDLMRRWSSCLRYAYNRLIENYDPAYLRKHLQKVFSLSSKYINDAIMQAQYKINSMKALGKNPHKLIFGGRKLFLQLKKNHLQGNRRKKLYKEWKEKRQGSAYSRGSLARVEDKIEEIKEKIKREKNEYKANALKKKLKEFKNNYNILLEKINSLQSGKSEPISQQPVNQQKERVRGNLSRLLNSWQVLSIAFAFSSLEKSQRDFSPLKRILISGDWRRGATRASSTSWGWDK
jgi:predicted transposase